MHAFGLQHPEESTLQLVLHLHGGMQIFVKTLTGNAITSKTSRPTQLIMSQPNSKMHAFGLQHPKESRPSSAWWNADLREDSDWQHHHLEDESSDTIDNVQISIPSFTHAL